MKFKSKGLNIIKRPIGALAGGVGAELINQHLPVENHTTKMAISAFIGAVLSAYTKYDITQGVGDGILGVVGSQLTRSFPSLTGVGDTSYLPSRHSVGRSSNWIERRRMTGEMSPNNPLPSGSLNVS